MVLLTDSSPLMKRRVLYIGSSVPLDTTAGLECIQGPLKERYPADQEAGIEGIDSILSVTSSCIQLQYVNDLAQVIQFPLPSLTLCAAVRCVTTVNGSTGEKVVKFVSLNDPLAGGENADRPAIFTAVTRRTQGRKVLECHGFICHSPQDAMKLVKFTSLAGKNYRKNGSVKATPRDQPPLQQQPQRQSSEFTFGAETLNRNSGASWIPVGNGLVNGMEMYERPPMRLIPGEPITVKAGPEFYEPVSKQGYFYSSDKTEVKKFNIAKLTKSTEPKENTEVEPPLEQPHTPRPMNGYGPPRQIRQAPNYSFGAPPPVYVRLQREAQPLRPFYYGPPMPPPMIYGRPRFFSPPPPRLRPAPFVVPPGPPPPMMAPPLYVRRPREQSHSGSRSNSAASSRSKSPKENNVTKPKRVPNGDANSSSDDTVTLRSATPSKDYSKPKSKGERRSRRDEYEIKHMQQAPRAPYPYPPPPPMDPSYPYDYYVYPSRHDAYRPFNMYNPYTRSRSLPPE